MSFEGLSYQSAGEVENTIQDQIQEGKIKIKHLTQERLKTLKVDIRDANSHLNIRDIKGNDIGDLFEDGKELTYLGDYKRDNNGKVFLHIQNSDGLKGYASAEYLKGEVNLGKLQINNQDLVDESEVVVDESEVVVDESEVEVTELIPEKNALIVNAMDIIDSFKRTEIIEKINACTTSKECLIISDEIQDIIESQKTTENPTSETLLSGLDLRLDQFRNIAQETEDLENILGVVWGEEEKIEQQKILLANKYQDILIIISELQKHNTPEIKQKLEGTYLFLAEYYSSNEESLDNDHMRDYNISTITALGVLKDKENCPNFPNLSELQAKFPNEEDFQRELELGLSAFDKRFENFANKIKDSTDQKAKKAIEIIEDNRGIGYFDFAEDITDSLFHGAGGVGAIIIGTAAVILTAPGWIVGGAIVGGAGLVGAGVNTMARGESDGLAQFAGEAGVLSVQVGAAGLIGKASIIALSTTTSKLAIAGILTAEMTGDVAVVGMLGDYLNSHVFDYDYKLGESFQENLIWAPLVLLGGGGKLLRGNLERAKIKKAVGDQQGVIDEVTQFNTRVGELKTELVGKEVNLDHNGSQITAKIEEDGNIQINDINGERTLDPENIDDQEIIKLLVKKIDSNNKATPKDSSKKQSETEVKSNKEIGENTGNTIYISQNGTEYKYIKEGAEGKIVVETKTGDIISVNKKNVKLKEGEKGAKEKTTEKQSQKEEVSETQNKENTSDKNESGRDSDKPKGATINKDDISFNTESGFIKIKGEKVHMVENKSFYMEGTDQQMYRVVTGEKGKIVDVLNVTKSNETSLSGAERTDFITNNINTIKQDFTIVLSKTESKAFNKEFTKLIEKDGVEINGVKYTKRPDGKYEMTGDQTLYTQKEIINKISNADKKAFIEKQAKSTKESLKDTEVKVLKDGNYIWGKYKISNKEIIIKNKDGTEKILTKSEETQFYKDNGAELLNKVHGIDLAKKWGRFSKLFENKSFTKSFENVMKKEGLIDKGATGLGNLVKHQLNPLRFMDEWKQAKGFGETMKMLLFGSKNISKKGILMQEAGIVGITAWESLVVSDFNDNNKSNDEIIYDFFENQLIFKHFSVTLALIYEAWEDGKHD